MYKKRKGMTLIEIILYIGLLGTVMMIVGLSFSHIKTKVEEIRLEEEVMRVKNFLNKQLLDSSKTAKSKKIQLAQNEIKETKTGDSLELIHTTIDVKNLSVTGFEIYEGNFSNVGFRIKLENQNKGVYIIEICKQCEKIHY